MACLYVKRDAPKLLGIGLLGGLGPDLSLYIMVAWTRFINGVSFREIFDERYFSDQWQAVFAIDNSFFVWSAILAIGFVLAKEWIKIFGLGALTHLIFDFALHHDDGRAHFWPLSNWKFESPVSYWDPNHHGQIVGSIELILVAAMVIILWRRFRFTAWMVLIFALGLLQVVPGVMFSWIL